MRSELFEQTILNEIPLSAHICYVIKFPRFMATLAKVTFKKCIAPKIARLGYNICKTKINLSIYIQNPWQNRSIIASCCKKNSSTSFRVSYTLQGRVLSRNTLFLKKSCHYKCCMIPYSPSLSALVQRYRWFKFNWFSPAFRPGLPPCISSWIPCFLVIPGLPI